jgi:hypothetical protein
VDNTQKYLLKLYSLKKQNTLLFEKLRTQEKRFEEFQSAVFSGQ